ncbi:MAG: hypothetical protein ACHQ4H_12545 [Ktedonobacterales bacterium]
MKKFLILGTMFTVVIAGVLIALPALAAPAHGAHASQRAGVTAARPNVLALEHPHSPRIGASVARGIDDDNFNFSCAQPNGNRIIDVTEKITNDADSGIAGDYWGFDTVTRHIQVWNVGPNTYCATVMYGSASFQAVAGQRSPGNTGTLTGDEYGGFHGGYETTVFTAALTISAPATWPAEGKVNGGAPINYACDLNGNCPGAVDWTTKYFTNLDPTFNLAQWGWIYHGRDHVGGHSTGTWVNSMTGNSGDILDVD